MARKSKKRAGEQVSMFGSDDLQVRPKLREWREIAIPDMPEGDEGLDALYCYLMSLLQRSRQFLKALVIAGVPEDLPAIVEFREIEKVLVNGLVLWKLGDIEPEDVPSVLDAAGQASEGLTALRAEMLAGIEPERARRAMAAEPRIRIQEFILNREISGLAFAIAEKEGNLVEFEIPVEDAGHGIDLDGVEAAGFILPSMVDALVAGFELQKKADAESRPLPRDSSLRALLRALPVPWLDSVVKVLGLEKRKRRAEREAEVDRRLRDPEVLSRIVGSELTDRERDCLALLMERGGEEKASVVTRQFGPDEGDGWFWDERPPASVLGRLRQHGLAYVGVRRKGGRRYRTVTVPDELRGPLGDLVSSR
ncbi:MAG: hypothetical protein JXR96_20815 [Deltaproteobacteria bacterium]|nr:hypothetical protein [Deltaproteobacteria bacterium]